MEKKNVKQVSLEYVYDHKPTLRRSGFNKSSWETIVHKFSITQYDPSKIQAIIVEGEDDFGHLQLSIIVEC